MTIYKLKGFTVQHGIPEEILTICDSHKLDLILTARPILVGFHLSATFSNLCPFIGNPEAIALFPLVKPLFLLLY